MVELSHNFVKIRINILIVYYITNRKKLQVILQLFYNYYIIYFSVFLAGFLGIFLAGFLKKVFVLGFLFVGTF